MGKRGPQKGAIYQPTKNKEQLRQALRDAYATHMEEMLEAQIANAKGLKYLVARNSKTGKFEKVTAAMLDADSGLENVEVWEKDPSVQAWSDLSNRAIDKPVEAVEMNVTGELDIVSVLRKARARLKKRGSE